LGLGAFSNSLFMKKYLFYLVLLNTFLLATCTRKNVIDIVRTDFKDEIDTHTNLKFTFDKAMVGDTMLNRWDTTTYMQIKPYIAGKFKWISPKELVFSPKNGFQPATKYEAVMHKSLVDLQNSKNGNDKNVSNKNSNLEINPNKKFSFHTPYLKIQKTETFWGQDNKNTPQIHALIYFNYKIDPQSSAKLISATIKNNNSENKPLANIQVKNREISNFLEIVIDEVPDMPLENQQINITLQKGILCVENESKSNEILNTKVEIASKKTLQVQEVAMAQENQKSIIKIHFSQNLNETESTFDKKYTLTPKIPHEIKILGSEVIIEGRFQQYTNYTLELLPEIMGAFGKLNKSFSQQVALGNLTPEINFLDEKANYLAKKGNKNVAINIQNVQKVQVKIYKIYENNLLYFLKSNNYVQNNSYNRNFDEYGELIVDRIYDTKSLPLVNLARVLRFDLDELSDTKGVYGVEVNSTEKQYLNDAKIISISDIGFIVRETKDDILVFTNSLQEAKALEKVKISLVAKNNVVVTRAETNAEGVAIFKDVKRNFPDADIKLLTAMHEKDFNYVFLDHKSRVDKSAYETGGYTNKQHYQAFLYGERDLYRPKETMYFNAVIRDKNWQKVSNFPVIFKLKMPNGRYLTSLKANTNLQGASEFSVKLPQDIPTGRYEAILYSADGTMLESNPVQVEEFMPDRIKVSIKNTEKDFYTTDKSIKLTSQMDSLRFLISAQTLFGTPVSNRNCDAYFSLEKSNFSSKKFKEYNFELEKINNINAKVMENNLENQNIELETDAKGFIKKAFFINPKYKGMGLLKANFYATIFDETGRSVSRNTSIPLYTQGGFLGIQNTQGYVSTHTPINIRMIALDTQENPLAMVQSKIQVVRYRWQTVLRRNSSGDMKYVSEKQEELLQETLATIGNAQQDAGFASVFSYTPTLSGEYEVRLSVNGSDYFTSTSFYAYKGGFTNENSFNIDKNGKINITLDKENYQINETAKVLFTTPFDGKLLVTIERDKVLQHFYLNTQNRSASCEISLKNEHLPNAYITATLIRPMSNGAIPLTVAHGFGNIVVKNPENTLDLGIEAIEKTESNQSQTIKVRTNRTESDIEVTLAVVDEGILQLKNYKNPDIYDFFFQKRALIVEGYDVYPLLFPEIGISNLATGGDGNVNAGRNAQTPNNRVKLVRFWSGILKTNAQGEAFYTIKIPQFSGSLRIMAVAYKDGRFGSASKSMVVADPIVVSTGLPRFLSPNDKVSVPVTLFNTTSQGTNASISIKTTSQLSILGESTKEITLKADQDGKVTFELQAKSVIDSAKVIVSVSALGRVFTETLDINIRPQAGLQKMAGTGVIIAGKSLDLNLENDWINQTTKGKLVLSHSPLVRFAKELDYLVEYPHGCLEQVISTAFPQLYVQNLYKTLYPNLKNTEVYQKEINKNIENAIIKLQSLQNYTGGLQYWADTYETHLFGTAYAVHFWLEARKLGYQVSEESYNAGLSFLSNQVNSNRNKGTKYTFTNLEGKKIKKDVFRKENLYALYVLTLAGQADIATMNYFKENSKNLALDSKYLLACSYLLAGNNEAYREILPTKFEGETSENDLNNSFHSPIRDMALALNAMIEADEKNPQIAILSATLADNLANHTQLTTQESAMSLLAMGKLAKKSENNKINAQILGNNTSYNTSDNVLGNFVGNDLTIEKITGKKINIKTQGQGNLYYAWSQQGLSATGKTIEKDNYLKVRRNFYDQQGNIIRNPIFSQNDLIVVKISISTDQFPQKMNNVVITDMLPAGLEIENPRLTQSKSLNWIKKQVSLDNIDVRDDRIHLFVNATEKTQDFYYLVRAVSVGTFQLGAVSADAMYNPNYYSYANSGILKIVERQKISN
jgi:alpha-2-macroglobulin